MNTRIKLALDIVLGAVAPILVLNSLSATLGTVTSYVVAALIPVVWVTLDLLFITRRFNFITSYVAGFTLLGGVLTFWFVDGLQYAIKDSLTSFLAVAVFGVSLLVGKPMMRMFTLQALNPTTPKQEAAAADLLQEPGINRALVLGTVTIMSVNLVTSIANVLLNLSIVTADFGTPDFNQQVARVNALTRVVLGIPEFGSLLLAGLMSRRAIENSLPEDEEDEYEFWELVAARNGHNVEEDQ